MSVQGRGEEAGSGGSGGEGEGARGPGGRAAAPGGGGAPQTGWGAGLACGCTIHVHVDIAFAPRSFASLRELRLHQDCLYFLHAFASLGTRLNYLRRCDEQAEEEERQRVEAERLAQQLRGRFLLRLWLASARRQREERALMRLAACSVAGSLPRSPGTAVASPDRAPPAQLKVSALQWHSQAGPRCSSGGQQTEHR